MKGESILDALKKRRKHMRNLRPPSEPGMYASFATRKTDLGDIPAPAGKVIYIGITKSGLHERLLDTHFNSEKTCRSTLRCSLGAILKTRLRLTARPRGRGESEEDFSHYRFQDAGEERLTKWMSESLEFGVLPLATEKLDKLEEELIHQEVPVLNLKGNEGNLYKKRIGELRKICRDEARRRFSQ